MKDTFIMGAVDNFGHFIGFVKSKNENYFKAKTEIKGKAKEMRVKTVGVLFKG